MPVFKSKLARYNCCEQVMPVPVIPKCAVSCCIPTPIFELPSELYIIGPPREPPRQPPHPIPCPICIPHIPPRICPSHQPNMRIPNYPPSEEPSIGTILTNITGSTPQGYVECDGKEISRITYSNLFLVIGIYFGAGDNVNTFNVPNLGDPEDNHYIIKF